MRKLLVFVLLLTGHAVAQTCHAVTVSGSGAKTGADWNNAYAGVPSTLVRGDVYYLADGTYGSYTFSSATGTGYIELRKAQSYDHCTATGWNTATMGSSQALFTRSNSSVAFNLSIDQIIINGNGTYSGAGCGGGPSSATDVTQGPVTPSDCGIAAKNVCTTATTNGCDDMIEFTGTADNFKLLYMEWQGLGHAQQEQYPVNSGVANDNSSTRLFEHIFQHDFGANILYRIGHRQVDHSYFWGNQRVQFPSNHGQYSYDGFLSAISGVTEFANVYRDIQGTAIWGVEDGPQTASNYFIYDNIIMSTTPVLSWVTLGVNNATLWCGNGSTCSNMFYVNNTHVNVVGARVIPSYQDTGTTTSNITQQNNLWYGMVSSGGPITKMNGTESNNSFLNSGTSICFTGTNDICNQSAPNPFVSSTSPYNFNLASDNSLWNNRISLGTPYDTDAAGNAFTSSRGAFQFGTGVCSNPTYSPVGGTYGLTQNVTLTAGCTTIQYCTDTNNTCTPTTTYSTAISVPTTHFVRAQASQTGSTSSSVVNQLYTIIPPAPAGWIFTERIENEEHRIDHSSSVGGGNW